MPFYLGDHPPLPAPRSGLIAEASMEPLDVLRRTADRAFEQVGNVTLEDRVGLEADGVLVALGLTLLSMSSTTTSVGRRA
jgi:hypothetical protein